MKDNMKYLFDIANAAATAYTLMQPLGAYIKSKICENSIEEKFEQSIKSGDIEEILKDGINEVIYKSKNDIKNGNYDIFMKDYQTQTINCIVSKYQLQIYEKQIAEYIQEFVKYLKDEIGNNANDKVLFDTIISINNRSECEANERLKQIKKCIYEAKNENRLREKTQINMELPFKIEEIKHTYELNKGIVKQIFSFKLSDYNYKVKPEEFFICIESESGIWIFDHKQFFLMYSYSGGIFTDDIQSCRQSVRKISAIGLVGFFKIYNRNIYYVRIFGRNDNYYYECLTKTEYEEQCKEYKIEYNNAIVENAGFNEWNKYYGNVMYTDFS